MSYVEYLKNALRIRSTEFLHVTLLRFKAKYFFGGECGLILQISHSLDESIICKQLMMCHTVKHRCRYIEDLRKTQYKKLLLWLLKNFDMQNVSF